MQLNIGNKDYTLKFGIKFLSKLDETYALSMGNSKTGVVNVPFNEGLRFSYQGLTVANPVALYNIIKAGTEHLNQKPSNEAIEEFLEDTDLLKLSEDFLEYMRNTNLLKLTIQSLDQATIRQMKLHQKQQEQGNK